MLLPIRWPCFHSWGFPRRRARFGEHCGVDVQTCAKCGAQRVSPVQFGSGRTATASGPEIARPVEVRS